MTKYREYFERMITQQSKAFNDFTKLHMKYSLDPDSFQKEFNQEGAKILTIIREWEGKLCSQSEKAGFGNYTTNLSEKFMTEVRKSFPLIDHIGIIVKNTETKKIAKNNDLKFGIKKINL